MKKRAIFLRLFCVALCIISSIDAASVYTGKSKLFTAPAVSFREGTRVELSTTSINGRLESEKTVFTGDIKHSITQLSAYKTSGNCVEGGDFVMNGGSVRHITTDAVVLHLRDVTLTSLTVHGQRKDFQGNCLTPLVFLDGTTIEKTITFHGVAGMVVGAVDAKKINNGSVVSSEKAIKALAKLTDCVAQGMLWRELIKKGDTALIKQAIGQGIADLNFLFPLEMVTPLMRAITEGKTATALALVEAGADFSSALNGTTVLQLAITHNNEAVFDALIHRGVNVHERVGDEQVTPLMWAAFKGRVSMVKKLLEAGADIGASLPHSSDTIVDLDHCMQHKNIIRLLKDAQAKRAPQDA